MKESEIRKEVLIILKQEGWTCWYPAKPKFKKDYDIFGVFDLVCLKKSKVRFIQFTTLHNIRAREKKVRDFLEKYKIGIYSEVWGYNENKKEFKILRIYG